MAISKMDYISSQSQAHTHVHLLHVLTVVKKTEPESHKNKDSTSMV